MAALKATVKGIALLESLLAIVLISLSLGIALSVFDRMTQEQRNYLVVRAEIALKTEATKCKTDRAFFDSEITGEEFSIERKVVLQDELQDLARLELKAVTPDGKVLSEYYELVFLP